MLYAKVVLGIPVEGPFDYIVPANLSKSIKVGVRVRVGFRSKVEVGYVVKLTKRTLIKNLKPILEVIDNLALLDKNMLSLTKEVSDYYCCCWGEAIETALPEDLRRGKKIPNIERAGCIKQKNNLETEVILFHDLDNKARWQAYLREIKKTTDNHKQALILLPDVDSVLKTKDIIANNLDIGSLAILYRKQPQELNEWVRVKQGKVNIVIGTRSSIFAPLNNLGLIVIDEEQDESYKQDQMPHYNAREVAFMRINIDKARLILGSSTPSLEIFHLARVKKIKYILIPKETNFPQIKIIDTHSQYYKDRQRFILSRYLEDAIASSLNLQGKTLLFLNRRGFATYIWCRHCARRVVCSRCNINLVYHFKDNILNCHYCNFKMKPPTICPHCNSGYIRYSGIGTEKIESELARIFPQARIKSLDKQKIIDFNSADIFVATQSIIRDVNYPKWSVSDSVSSGSRSYTLKNSNIRDDFNLIGVLAIDNLLNRIDFRSAEKTFNLLVGLLRLTTKKLVIQTGLPNHYCFKGLVNSVRTPLDNFVSNGANGTGLSNGVNIFYNEELRQRRQLNLPPYKHLGIVKLRGKKETRVKEVAWTLFKRLNRHRNKTISIVSVNPGFPFKLRDNFYWQVLLKSDSGKKISKFLKIYLKDFSHSGIIVTVDIDPL